MKIIKGHLRMGQLGKRSPMATAMGVYFAAGVMGALITEKYVHRLGRYSVLVPGFGRLGFVLSGKLNKHLP